MACSCCMLLRGVEVKKVTVTGASMLNYSEEGTKLRTLRYTFHHCRISKTDLGQVLLYRDLSTGSSLYPTDSLALLMVAISSFVICQIFNLISIRDGKRPLSKNFT